MKRMFFYSILFLAINVEAHDPCYTYLVYVSSFPAGFSTLINKGKFKNQTYPFMNTATFLLNSNTNYVMLRISTTTVLENSFFKTLEQSGYIRKIYYSEPIEYIDVDGRFIKDVIYRDYLDMPKILNPLPLDFNKDWKFVEKSSGTP